MFFQAAEVIYYIGQSSIVLPVAVGLRYRRRLSPSMRAMLYCCLMWLVMMTIAEVTRKLLQNNNGANQSVDILEVWCIGVAYYHALHSKWRRYFLAVGMFYTLFALCDFFVLNDLWGAMIHRQVFTYVYTVFLKHILIICLVLLYFEQSIATPHISSLLREPMFIVSIGLLLFYLGTLAIFLTHTSIVVAERWLVYLMVSVVNFILHLLLTRAFWLDRSTQPPGIPA